MPAARKRTFCRSGSSPLARAAAELRPDALWLGTWAGLRLLASKRQSRGWLLHIRRCSPAGRLPGSGRGQPIWRWMPRAKPMCIWCAVVCMSMGKPCKRAMPPCSKAKRSCGWRQGRLGAGAGVQSAYVSACKTWVVSGLAHEQRFLDLARQLCNRQRSRAAKAAAAATGAASRHRARRVGRNVTHVDEPQGRVLWWWSGRSSTCCSWPVMARPSPGRGRLVDDHAHAGALLHGQHLDGGVGVGQEGKVRAWPRSAPRRPADREQHHVGNACARVQQESRRSVAPVSGSR